jgi:hypothetical protein
VEGIVALLDVPPSGVSMVKEFTTQSDFMGADFKITGQQLRSTIEGASVSRDDWPKRMVVTLALPTVLGSRLVLFYNTL